MLNLLLFCFFLFQDTNAQVKVVSLAPSLTELVCALNACDQLVGVTDYCLFPAQVTHKAKIGGYLNPNLERITALSPDLVLALPEHRDVTEKLQVLGIKTATIKNYSIADVYQSVEQIGELLHRRPEASRLMGELKRKVALLTHPRKGKPRCLLVLGSMGAGEQGLRELYLVGRNGFLNELLTMAGGENAWRETQPYFPKIGQEALLELNPDIIIELVPASTVSNADQLQKKDAWSQIPFLKAGKEHYHLIYSDHVLQAGPRFVETLERLNQILDRP